ncbi:glycosyltransferase, partial [Desulfosoma sp.]|uniref:glycosyltransferase n=1 Tax=Desulfosoma sp. TaxID=2603217 RepID=UPI00404B4310
DLAAGGAQQMNVRLAQQLMHRGWEVGLAVLFSRAEVIAPAMLAGLAIHRFNATGLPSKLAALLRLSRLARRYELVIGGVELAATNYGYLAARLAGRPFLSWNHNHFARYQVCVGVADRAISRWVYRRCPQVVFPSLGALEGLRQVLGKTPRGARWQVIENFIDRPSAPASNAVPDPVVFAKPVVIGIGRLAEQKAFDRLIRVHATLRAEGLDHHLLILGDGPLRAELKAQAQALGVAQTVFMPGHVGNVLDWLRHSAVFALCSRYEGLPLVLLEALSCGVPVAAMDCPSGPREILQDGRFGLLVPDGDEAALTEAIGRLLRDATLRARYAALGIQRAADYRAERIMPRWEALLGEIVAAHRRRRG